jgi:hypothetical protein
MHRGGRVMTRGKGGNVRRCSRSAALVCSCTEGRRRRGERPLESKKGGAGGWAHRGRGEMAAVPISPSPAAHRRPGWTGGHWGEVGVLEVARKGKRGGGEKDQAAGSLMSGPEHHSNGLRRWLIQNSNSNPSKRWSVQKESSWAWKVWNKISVWRILIGEQFSTSGLLQIRNVLQMKNQRNF